MNILAFDTCLDRMYVALSIDGELKFSKIIESTESHYHSAFLISTIRDVLVQASIEPKDVDVVATNVGPGSFTGIRACTTVARVFAQEMGAKTVGVSSLEILSRLVEVQDNSKVIVLLDARKNMAYTAIYENKKEILAPKAILIEDIKNIMASDEYQVVTDNKLKEIFGRISYTECDLDLGKILIEIATEKLNQGVEVDWKKLHPLYIQPPPVTVKK